MRVNLQIEEDEEFRQHVKDMISGVVRGILREELSGIVSGEIAKLRLLDPKSPAMGERINKQIEGLIARIIQQEFSNRPLVDHLNFAVRERLAKL
jgi:hypothetical protein